jgi:hypothetical protein
MESGPAFRRCCADLGYADLARLGERHSTRPPFTLDRATRGTFGGSRAELGELAALGARAKIQVGSKSFLLTKWQGAKRTSDERLRQPGPHADVSKNLIQAFGGCRLFARMAATVSWPQSRFNAGR